MDFFSPFTADYWITKPRGMQQLEDETRSDRVIGIETDDENYEAEWSCENEEDVTDSDVNPLSNEHSANHVDQYPFPWPQSYRYAISMKSRKKKKNFALDYPMYNVAFGYWNKMFSN